MRLLPESIRGRVVMLAVAIGLPLIGVLVWGFAEEVNRQQVEARDLALRISRTIARDIEESNARAHILLEKIARRQRLKSPSAEDCEAMFAIVDVFSQYPDLVLFDADARVVCSAQVAAADVPYTTAAETVIVRAVQANAIGDDKPLMIYALDRWIYVVFQPVIRNGTRTGVLALMQYVDLSTDAYPAGTVITIADKDRRIVARSAEAEKYIGKVGTNLNPTPWELDESRREAPGIDGVLRQYGMKRVRAVPWRVSVGLPSSAVMAGVRSFLIRGAIVGAIILTLVTIFAVRLTRTIEQPLAILARTVKRAAAPGTSEQVLIEGPREVQVVAEAFNETIRTRAEAEAALVQSTLRLEALSEKLLEVQEEERSRIAREIHDELGQLLTALNMDIGGLLASATLSVEHRAMAKRIRQALGETLSSVQRISAELRPAALDDFGLVAAIELELDKFEQRTGIECDLSVPATFASLGSDVDAAIFRIVQEAMTNVARHSHATRVEVRLRLREDELLVEIRDDGRGISDSAMQDRGSIGLIGMRERARRIGARLDIEGIAGHGTIVSLRLPVPHAAEVVQA
jgi:signal transduction histidine kinase